MICTAENLLQTSLPFNMFIFLRASEIPTEDSLYQFQPISHSLKPSQEDFQTWLSHFNVSVINFRTQELPTACRPSWLCFMAICLFPGWQHLCIGSLCVYLQQYTEPRQPGAVETLAFFVLSYKGSTQHNAEMTESDDKHLQSGTRVSSHGK